MKIENRFAQERALCELLGLDANQTVNVVVEWSAGEPTVARWEGYKVLTDEELVALGELLSR